MAKMKTPKHNFPEGKAVICNEKITLKNYKILFAKCLKANIRIGELFLLKPICKDYIYFGWDGYKICRYYKDNDLPKVSIKEFNSFFNQKKPKEKTYKIKQETGMDSITINDVKYIKEDKDSYKITREQILELHDKIGPLDTRYELRDMFPEAFETKRVEFNKWVVTPDYPKWIVKYDKDNDTFYGLNINGDWFHADLDNRNPNQISNVRYATEQEVTEALTKEAVKRGLKEGAYVMHNDKVHMITLGTCCGNKSGYFFDSFGRLLANVSIHYNVPIFDNGQWAEIIPTLTIQEAEAKLNCKIV